MLNIIEQVQDILRNKDLRKMSLDMDKAITDIDDLLDSQMEIVAQRVMPELQGEIADLAQHSINKALEPWLLSPIGLIVRIALITVHKGVREGIEAALAGEEGRNQLTALLKKSTTVILEEIAEPENLSDLQMRIVEVLESTKSLIAEAIKTQEG